MTSASRRTASNADAPIQLLVVDYDRPIRDACCEVGQSLGFFVQGVGALTEARSILQSQEIDVLLLDLKTPEGNGIDLLNEVRSISPSTVVIVMTALATVSSAVEAMRSGATDYLTKPFDLEELSRVLEHASQRRAFDRESRRSHSTFHKPRSMGTLIGRTPEMERLFRMIAKVAQSTHPVLILGESGTGKEVVARSIHQTGPMASRPFVAVDCSVFVPTLIESELFGHVRGAFTGANRPKEGLLVSADQGTIFLDEVGELPLDLQGRLLRALQEREIRPVGATHSVPIRSRVLAATNRDLAAMVDQGTFRKDLYFRLNVVNLRVPPLRDRRNDIPLLAEHILKRINREQEKTFTLSEETNHLMMEYDWPGNVRELENAIEHACTLSSGPVLNLLDLPSQLRAFHDQSSRNHSITPQANAGLSSPNSGPILTIAELEKQAIINTIRQLNGDKLMAAKLLGIGKTTLYRKLKEYGIDL